MESIKRDHDSWICQLSRNGTSSYIVWNAERKVDFDRPKDVDTIRKLSGESVAISGNKIEISSTPVLLDRSPH